MLVHCTSLDLYEHHIVYKTSPWWFAVYQNQFSGYFWFRETNASRIPSSNIQENKIYKKETLLYDKNLFALIPIFWQFFHSFTQIISSAVLVSSSVQKFSNWRIYWFHHVLESTIKFGYHVRNFDSRLSSHISESWYSILIQNILCHICWFMVQFRTCFNPSMALFGTVLVGSLLAISFSLASFFRNHEDLKASSFLIILIQ